LISAETRRLSIALPEAPDGSAPAPDAMPACWPPRWGFVVSSIGPGISLASLGYRFWSGPQEYTQFIAGALAWMGGSKPQDFALLLCLVAGYLASLTAWLLIAERLARVQGAQAVGDLHSLSIYLSLPLALWIGPLLFTRDRSLPLVHIASVLVAAGVLYASAAASRRRPATRHAVLDTVGGSIVVLLFSGASGLAIGVAAAKLGVLWGIVPSARHAQFGRWASVVAIAAGAVVLAVLWWRSGRGGTWPQIEAALSVAQAGIPLFFLFILPTPWVDATGASYPPQMHWLVWIGISALVLLTLADIVKRRERLTGDLWRRVSPFCLVALLIFLKVPPTAASIPIDDYHFGEFVTPWWSWWWKGMVPFWDFAPARGLINYLSGLLSSGFFDGTAAAILLALPLQFAVVTLVAFPPIARMTGAFAAFVGLLFLPPAHTLSEAELLLAAAICLLAWGYTRWRPTAWLLVWVVLGVLGVLIAAGQGGLLVLATMPVGASAAWRAWRTERIVLYRAWAGAAVVMAALALASPLRWMVIGAIRYGVEQSSVNDIAHGVPWAASGGIPLANPLTWEAARASWIVVALVCGALLLAAWRHDGPHRRAAVPLVVPVFLLAVLYIVRAAGRIDPDGITRLGYTSLWMVGILLPAVLATASGNRRRPGVVFTVLAICGLLLPQTQMRDVTDVLTRAAEVSPAPPALDARAPAQPHNIGHAHIDPAHLNRLQAINRQLSLLLDPGETYLDLTNRNAQYFYLDRMPPIETAAVYNLVDERQQLRAVASLRARQPPVVLADADSIRHDGGSVAFRSHLLYRYVVKHYVPISTDGLVLMVLPSRLGRVPLEVRMQPLNPAFRSRLLARVFRQDGLALLPVSWGRSRRTLDSQLREVRRLDGAANASEASRNGNWYTATGQDPSVTIALTPTLASGAEAGMLSLDFTCEGNAAAVMVITWTDAGGMAGPVQLNARDGHMIVPLDASPRWLLAEQISSIRLSLRATTCTRFTIENVTLSQRRLVDRIPGL
jgi:hypothetical protein